MSELNSGSGVPKTEKPQKHLVLYDALCSHSAVLRRLVSLVERIEGSINPKDKGGENPNPSLVEFLDRGTDEMKLMTDVLSTQLNKLEEMLF